MYFYEKPDSPFTLILYNIIHCYTYMYFGIQDIQYVQCTCVQYLYVYNTCTGVGGLTPLRRKSLLNINPLSTLIVPLLQRNSAASSVISGS